MQTRVPAWCDRVLLSPTAKMLVQDVRNIIYIFSKRVSFRQIVFYAMHFSDIIAGCHGIWNNRANNLYGRS